MANAAGYLLFMSKYYFLKLLDLPRPPPTRGPIIHSLDLAPQPQVLIF